MSFFDPQNPSAGLSSGIRILVRCYAELNDLLPPPQRFRDVSFEVPDGSNVASVLALLRVPPNHVDLVLRNGFPSRLETPVADGDRLSVYPVFETFDISSVTRLRGAALREPRFIADVHLGKLANHLRMFGFDTMYETHWTDEALVALSVHDRRTLLSKDRTLLKDVRLTHRHLVRASEPRAQIIEVIRHFDLASSVRPFSRCIECNEVLSTADKQDIVSRLPEKVRDRFNEFRRCRRCDRIYWNGSHFEHMQNFITGVLREASHADGADGGPEERANQP